MAHQLEAAVRELALKTPAERLSETRKVVESMQEDQKREFAVALAKSIPPPDQTISNTIWLIIIWAFVTVMVIAAVTLCVSVFCAPVKDATKPEIILTVFTTVTAFLAGLFAPSPVASNA